MPTLTSRKGQAVITDLQDTSDFSLKTPYLEEFVETLKDAIDPAYRTFDVDAKCWVIDYDYFRVVARIVSRYFREIVIRDPHDKHVYAVTWPDEEPTI